MKKLLPTKLLPDALVDLYVKFKDPESHLKVLFYEIPFTDQYFVRFPKESWILIDLSCYDSDNIKHWIEQRVSDE